MAAQIVGSGNQRSTGKQIEAKAAIRNVAGLCALLALVTLAYSNHFNNAFHFDDSHTVVQNPYIRSLDNLRVIFTDTTAFSTLPANRTYRPLVTVSLALDYAMSGGLNPLFFHLSTFVWFCLQVVLMYALFQKIFDLARPDPRNSAVALLATGIYAIHPAIAETVNYVIQRGDVYSTLGVIAALLLYAAFPSRRKTGLYLLPLALAILSKPPALVFPAILFAYVRLFEEKQFLPALKKCIPALAVTAATGYLVTAMTPATYTPTENSAYFYRITQPLVALRYFRSFVLPTHLTADTDFVAVTGLLDRGAWLGFLFVAAVIAVAWKCGRAAEWKPVAFGLWWFLLALAPTSAFALSEVENDHRMYFPFAGLTLAACWTIALAVYRRRTFSRPAIAAGAAACVLLFAGMAWATRARNEIWRTDESLWLDVTIKSPKNGRGLMNYGLTQMEKGDYRRALEYFERAAVFNPSYSFLEINRGIANAGLNQKAEAEAHFLRAIELSPNIAESHYFYARWLRQEGRTATALAELDRTIQLNPDYLPAQYLAMQTYGEQGDAAKARELARGVLQRFPSDNTAQSFLAQADRNPDGTGTRVIQTAPQTADDYVQLSLDYYRSGRFEDSVQAAQQALKLQPKYAAAYNNIAAAHAQLRNWDRAIEAAQAALKIQPDFQLARNNLAWAESQKKLEEEKRSTNSQPAR